MSSCYSLKQKNRQLSQNRSTASDRLGYKTFNKAKTGEAILFWLPKNLKSNVDSSSPDSITSIMNNYCDLNKAFELIIDYGIFLICVKK